MKEINSPIPLLSCFGHFIDGIKEELCSLWSYKVRHEKREAKSTTHFLAKVAVTHVINTIWMEEISPCIFDIVCKEQDVLSL